MRFALCFALLTAPLAASAQTSTAPITLCGHAVRLGADHALTGLRGGPLTLAPGEVSVEPHTLARGAAAVVRVTREGAPVEALVAVCAGSAAPALAWRGGTAWRGEDIGDRVREDVVATSVSAGRVELAIERQRESPRLCGLDAWVSERALVDPVAASVGAFAATDPRSGVSRAGENLPVTAEAPRTGGFRPRNVVTSTGDARALFDRDPRSAWTPGPHGFATVTLPSGAFVLRGLDLTPSTTASPRRWSLLVARARRTDDAASGAVARFDFELPAGPLGRDRVWRVSLAQPIAARCVSLVARDAAPAETLADVALRSALDDGATALTELSRSVDGADGDEAASMLVELGPAGVSALAAALPDLSPLGARRAMRALATSPDASTAEALTRALSRAETADDAAAALRRLGPAALAALSSTVATEASAARVIASTAAPLDARLGAIAPLLGAEREVWIAARPSLASLVAEAAAAHAGEAWMRVIPAGAREASRALRVTAEVFAHDDPTRAAAAERALALWASSDDFETRYRLLGALAGNEAGRERLVSVLRDETDHDLRAEAARALRGEATATEALRTAANDRVPRVRIAAIEALRGREGVTEALVRSLTNDAWPSVRAAAASALANDPAAASALLDALEAGSTVTVRAVIEALAENRGAGITARLAAFLEGSRRSPELRREAAEALGARCDLAAAPTLERVAEELSDPALPPWEQAVGHAALASLARLDGARARAFLTRSEANSEAASAVARAARQACR